MKQHTDPPVGKEDTFTFQDSGINPQNKQKQTHNDWKSYDLKKEQSAFALPIWLSKKRTADWTAMCIERSSVCVKYVL